MTQYTNEAADEMAVATDPKEKALLVMLLDAATRAVLELVDPQAVKQAIAALGGTDPLAEYPHVQRVVARIKQMAQASNWDARNAEETARYIEEYRDGSNATFHTALRRPEACDEQPVSRRPPAAETAHEIESAYRAVVELEHAPAWALRVLANLHRPEK